MFAGSIDLVCRHIGSHVAFFTRIGFTRHFNRKRMPRMAGRAGAHAAVQINAPHTLIRPALDNRKFQFAGRFGVTRLSAGQLQFGAVAVKAGFGPGCIVGRRLGYFPVFVFC